MFISRNPSCNIRIHLKGMDMWFPVIFLAVLLISDVVLSKEGQNECEDVKIFSREEWRARNPMRVRKMHLPLNHIVISHTVTSFCFSELQCKRGVQFIQDMHLDDRGWWDIAYNFLIGGDGNVYEGRGWLHTGSHAVNYNTNSYGVSFIGNFNKDTPTQPMINATRNLIRCGIKKGYIVPTVEIHGHRDVACTESPGKNLYAEIRQWDNFKGGRLPLYYCKRLEPPVVNKDIVNN